LTNLALLQSYTGFGFSGRLRMTIYIALLRFLRNACIVEFPDFPGLTVTIPNPAAARTQASGILLRHIQELRHRNRAPPAPTPAGQIMGRRRSHDAVPMLIRVPPLE
jgi:hypothetical protein